MQRSVSKKTRTKSQSSAQINTILSWIKSWVTLVPLMNTKERRVGVTLTRMPLSFKRTCLYLYSLISLRCVWAVARTNPTPITAIFWRACGAISLRLPKSFFPLSKESIVYPYYFGPRAYKNAMHNEYFVLKTVYFYFHLNVAYVGTISTLNDNTVWMVRGVSHLHSRAYRPMKSRILILFSRSTNWEIHTNSHEYTNYYCSCFLNEPRYLVCYYCRKGKRHSKDE